MKYQGCQTFIAKALKVQLNGRNRTLLQVIHVTPLGCRKFRNFSDHTKRGCLLTKLSQFSCATLNDEQRGIDFKRL